MMRYIRHTWKLFCAICGYAWKYKVWWFVPLVILLGLLGAFVVATQAVAPFIYTMF